MKQIAVILRTQLTENGLTFKGTDNSLIKDFSLFSEETGEEAEEWADRLRIYLTSRQRLEETKNEAKFFNSFIF